MVKFPFPFVRNKLRFFFFQQQTTVLEGSNGRFLFANITWFVNLIADENNKKKRAIILKFLKRLSFAHESMLELFNFTKRVSG